MKPAPEKICPLCGGANICAPAAEGSFDVACWCSKTTVSPAALARLPPELIGKACLCPRCASGMIEAHQQAISRVPANSPTLERPSDLLQATTIGNTGHIDE